MKSLKKIRPNIEYAELLKNVALKISVLEDPISPDIVEQIRDLSKRIIEQGEKEKIEFEKFKKDFALTAFEGLKQKYESDSRNAKGIKKKDDIIEK